SQTLADLCIRGSVLFVFFALLESHAAAARPLPQDNSPHGTIEVHLRLIDGSQFSGLARVRILTQGGPELAENTVDASGKTTMTDLQTGNYIVEATAAGYLAATEPVRLEMR